MKSCNFSAEPKDRQNLPAITDYASIDPKAVLFFKATLNTQLRIQHFPTTSPVRSILTPTAA